MKRVRNADDFSRQVRSIRNDYEQQYKLPIDKIRELYSDKTAGILPPTVNNLLEAHVRQYFIDQFLCALNWQFESLSPERLPNLVPEAPVHSLAEGTIRFLDYFGMDGGTEKALLIVETKRPSSSLPLPKRKRKRVIRNDEAFKSFIGDALIGKGDLTQEWQEWLETLRDYVKSIQAQSGNSPRRVVITNGDWLVLFTNPEDAFCSSYPNQSEIFVYPNQHKIQESAYEIFGFLEYHSVLGKTPPLSLGEISFYLRPEQLERAMFGLRLVYFQEPEFYYETSPGVKVMPVVFLRSKQGVWFRVEAQNQNHTQRIPSKSEHLLTHLETVNDIAKSLLNTINTKLGITLSCSSLAEHYASHELFDELPGVVKLPGNYEEFLIVTGSYTHYLLEESTIPDCPYHSWDNSDAEGYAAGSHPVKRPSVNAPRTIFVTDVQHHCSHRDVKLAKSSQITLENRQRCGNRSGKDQAAFCEIWKFEEHLCCRTCAFEEVCTKAEVFNNDKLPCYSTNLTVDELCR